MAVTFDFASVIFTIRSRLIAVRNFRYEISNFAARKGGF